MRPLPNKVVEGLTTKSARIRALAAAGFERTEIRDFLKISYQHVRNVLARSEELGFRRPIQGHQPIEKATPSPAAPWPRERLLSAGFRLLGEWRSVDDATFKLTVAAPSDAGVYAFVVDGAVRYIGLTQTGIRRRLGHYVYGHVRQRTSARVKALILEALSQGSQVEVLVAFPPKYEWNGLPVDGAAGLETGLIRAACPAWNKQGITPSPGAR